MDQGSAPLRDSFTVFPAIFSLSQCRRRCQSGRTRTLNHGNTRQAFYHRVTADGHIILQLDFEHIVVISIRQYFIDDAAKNTVVRFYRLSPRFGIEFRRRTVATRRIRTDGRHFYSCLFRILMWRHDFLRGDTQHNDIHSNGVNLTLSIKGIMLY